MTGSVVLDLLLIVLLIIYAIFGFRRGFILSLGSFAGIVAGAVASFFAIPLVTNWVTESQLRLPVILVVVVALIALGQAAGSALGRVIRRRVDKTPLRAIDPGAGQTAAQQVSARSVVKITGNAYQCGQNQSGSGFVSSSGRVVTNAHVVAGVTEPVVFTPAGGTYTGRVVYFDAVQDLAVIAVSGLTTTPLPLGADLATGASAVFDGYPLGGPFVSSPAAVQIVATIDSPDIYGANPSPREVYYLAADVQEGNSGGPLIDTAGSVTGVVFARSATTRHLGFAMTTKKLAPVVSQAQGLSAAVSSGTCTRG